MMFPLQQLLNALSQSSVFVNLCVLVASVLIIQELQKRFKYRHITQQMPTAYGWPLLGVTTKWLPPSKFFSSFELYFEKFQSYTFFAWLGPEPFIVTVDPDIIKDVLTREEFLEKSHVMYSLFNAAFNDGIISSSVAKWKHNRKLMNSSFTHAILTSFIPIFQKGSREMKQKLNALVGQGEQDVFKIMKNATLRIAFETTMGFALQEAKPEDEQFFNCFTNLIDKMAIDAMLSFWKLGFLVRSRQYRRNKNFLRTYLNNLMYRKQMLRDSNNNKLNEEDANIQKTHEKFLDRAIKFYDQGKFDVADVVNESYTMITGSFETISTTIYSVLVMLAMHPDIQEKVFEEVITVLPTKDMQVEYEHVKELSYLEMVIDETLRLMPSVPFIGRQLTNPAQLHNIHLPKGMQISIPIYNLHRRTDIWGPDAESFNPDNFLPENVAQRHAYAYMPFSKGVRNCIGWRYAQLALRVILLDILRNYKFSTNVKYDELRFVVHVSIGFDKLPLLAVHHRM